MPAKHTNWSCTRCRNRFRTFFEAESCELRHIVADATNQFRDDLSEIMAREPVMKSPKERFRS